MIRLTPAHPLVDVDHMRAIADSMEANGWQGVPLLVISDDPDHFWGGQLLTGVHRSHAWKEAGYDDEDLPITTLEEVFAEYDLDYEAIWAKYEPMSLGDYYYMITHELPQEAIETYGIQC